MSRGSRFGTSATRGAATPRRDVLASSTGRSPERSFRLADPSAERSDVSFAQLIRGERAPGYDVLPTHAAAHLIVDVDRHDVDGRVLVALVHRRRSKADEHDGLKPIHSAKTRFGD